MTTATRGDFLRLASAGAAIPLPRSTKPTTKPRHDFLSAWDDPGERSVVHQYPDECEAFSAFMLSVVNFTYEGHWEIARAHDWAAVAVDFRSATEAEAEVAWREKWRTLWDLPVGNASTVAGRVTVNAQNDRVERYLTIFAPAVSQGEFWQRVTSWLNGKGRGADGIKVPSEGWTLEDRLGILSSGIDWNVVHLFSRWKPSKSVLAEADESGLVLVHYPLSAIPREDLEMNRYYHVWHGTHRQGQEFRDRFWAPTWKHVGAT